MTARALLVLALASCGGGRATPPAGPGPIANVATADAGPVDLFTRVMPLFPKLAGARVLEDPTLARADMVQAAWCIDASAPRAVAEALQKELAALGWRKVTLREQTSDSSGTGSGTSAATPSRFNITGVIDDDLMMFARVESGRWSECDGSMTFVSLHVGQRLAR
jgi:hypothetical protein